MFANVAALARDKALDLEIHFGNGDILRFVGFTLAEFSGDDVIVERRAAVHATLGQRPDPVVFTPLPLWPQVQNALRNHAPAPSRA